VEHSTVVVDPGQDKTTSFTAFSFARQMRLLISVVQSPLAVFIDPKEFELLYLLSLFLVYLQV